METQQAQVTPGRPGPGPLNQNFLDAKPSDPRRELPQRPTTRVRMRVKVRDCSALQIESNLVGAGEQEIVVTREFVPKVLAMVEDPKLIAAARDQFANDFAEEVGKAIDGWMEAPAITRRYIESRELDKVNEAVARVMQTTALSVQATFTRMNKRGMRPLDFAEVIAGSEHPEPQREAMQNEVQKNAETFALALDRVLAKYAGVVSPDAIKALVKEQLEAELGGKTGGTKSR